MTQEEKQEIINVIIEFLEENGSQVGGQKVRDLTLAEMTDENLSALIIPSTTTNGEWVQTTLKTMMRPITNNISDLTTLKSQTTAAMDAANTAAAGAANVNAGLQGVTVTITDRNGVSRSVDIGFGIDNTYESVDAMNADAANVQEGKFVVIATTDPTSEDNAKMYIRNAPSAVQPFGLICDLDQASSAAWADWLNNMKPVIQQATTDANSAATLANTKAGVAQTAATNADNKANYANTEADRAKNLNDHPAYIGNDDYWYFWNYTLQAYVKGEYARGDAATIAVGSVETLEPDQRATVSNSGTQGAAVFNFGIPKGVKGDDGEKGDKGDDLDYSTMTQEEKEELSSIIVQKVVEDNILSPYYDNFRECVVIPLSMKAEYDAERGCTVFG